MRRKLLSMLLAVIMVVQILPVLAQADEGNLMYRGMSDATGTWQENEEELLPVDNTAFGSIGWNRVIWPYCGETRLENGILRSSDDSVILVNPMRNMVGVIAYEVKPVGAGTATLTYYDENDQPVCSSQPITIPLPDGLYKAQERTSANLISGFVRIEQYEAYTIWYSTEDGLTQEQLADIRVTMDGETDTYATATPVERAEGSGKYDLKIVFHPDHFLRNVFVRLRVMEGTTELLATWVNTWTLGKSAGEFHTAQDQSAETLIPDGSNLAAFENVWFMTADGLTEAEFETLEVSLNGSPEASAVTVEKEKALRSGTEDRYDARLSMDLDALNAKQMGFSIHVQYTQNPGENEKIIEVNLNNLSLVPAQKTARVDPYVISFNVPVDQNGQFSTHVPTVSLETKRRTPAEVYSGGKNAYVDAKKWSSSEKTYVEAGANEVKLEIQSVRLEPSVNYGNQRAISLQKDGYADSLTVAEGTKTDRITLYNMEGCQGSGAIVAQVLVKILDDQGQVTEQRTVEITGSYRQTFSSDYEVSDGVSNTEQLNAKLQELADIPVSSEVKYYVNLEDDTTYTGKIEIPEEFFYQTRRLYLSGGENTFVEEIDLNGAYLYELKNVHFQAASHGVGKAIHNGYCNGVIGCSFQGYEVAVDSTAAGYICVERDNLFADNGIAVRIDIEDVRSNFSNIKLSRNTFIDNGTAFQVLSLTGHLFPYNFRVYDSNFIDNDTDFDVKVDGNFYFYRNYYGQWKNGRKVGLLPKAVIASNYHNVLQYRAPVVLGEDQNTHVITNSRWHYPVKELLKYDNAVYAVLDRYNTVRLAAEEEPEIVDEGPEYDNFKTADWERETWLLNNENDLNLAAEAFDTMTTGEALRVLNDQEATLGTWNFEKAASDLSLLAGTAGEFNAKLEVTPADGELQVSVHNSNVLQSLQPTLTIPCSGWDYATVTYNGEMLKNVQWDSKSCAVTFAPEVGGTYTIREAVLPAPDGFTLREYRDGSFTGPYLRELDHGYASTGTYGVFFNGEQLKDYTVEGSSTSGSYKASVDENGLLTLTVLKYNEFQIPFTWGEENSTQFRFRYTGDQTYAFTRDGVEYTMVFGRLNDESITKIANTFFGMDTENGMQPVGVAIYTNYQDSNDQEPADETVQNWITDVEFSIVKDVNGAMSVTEAQETAAGWWKATVTPNCAGDGYVQAVITLNGEEEPIVLTMAGRVFEPKAAVVIDCAALGVDTWDELQALFNDLRIDEDMDAVEIHLAPGVTYDGSSDEDHLLELNNCKYATKVLGTMDADGNPSTIVGGVKLMNIMTSIENICFLAPEAENTVAVTHGKDYAAAWWIQNCAFIGYDVAVDCAGKSFTIPSSGNFFMDNGVALRIDCGDVGMPNPNSQIGNSVFLYNDTAVQVVKLPDTLMRYNFRIENCDFLNNTCDFDVPEGKPYYFHQNYFGDTGSGLAAARPAKVQGAVASEIAYENPLSSQGRMGNVWWQTVLTDFGFVFTPESAQLLAAEPANALVQALTAKNFRMQATTGNQLQLMNADGKTEVLNSTAQKLNMDGTNLPGATIQVNDMKDGEDVPMAFWDFPETMTLMDAASPGSFSPWVKTIQSETGVQLIMQDTPGLAALKPTLTLASPWEKVQVFAPDGSVQEAVRSNAVMQNAVTFRITSGGPWQFKPYDPLSLLRDTEQGAQILVGREHIGKQLLIASYGAGQKFLGFTPETVPESCILTVSGMEQAQSVKVFLVDDMKTMVPLTQALPLS